LRLRGRGRELRGGLRLAPSLLVLGHVEEGDGEVDARERERGVEPQRASEGFGALAVFELFEQRDAEVVRAVRLLARRAGRCVRRARTPLLRVCASRRGRVDEGQTEEEGGELARASFHV
jgi:hypothetical protein